MQFTIQTKGHNDFHNITERIEDTVRVSGIQNGILCAFVTGTTAGMVVMDNESGLMEDFRRTLEKLAPEDASYDHNSPGDMNGYAHIRSILVGPSVCIPIMNGELALGTWQRIFVVDFDWRER